MKGLFNSIRQKVFPLKTEFPIKLGFCRGKFGSDFLLRHHPEAEIQFIKKGMGAYYIRNRRYPFVRNTVLLIKPNLKHRYMHWTGQYVEKIALMFSLNLINDRRLVSGLPVHFRLSDKEAAEAEMLLNSIREEKAAKREYWQEMVVGKTILFLILLKRVSAHAPRWPAANPLIDKVHDYLDRHYDQEISVGRLAAQFHISPSHLAHLFKQNMKTSIKQYILWRRVLEAKYILRDHPSLKATVLAQMVGFNDYALFHRSFKRHAEVNLSTYRHTMIKN